MQTRKDSLIGQINIEVDFIQPLAYIVDCELVVQIHIP